MIKINLTGDQRAKIEKLMTKDIDDHLYTAIKEIQIYLNDNKFMKTAELINTKEKIYRICLLKNKSALIDFQEKFKIAFEEDSKDKYSSSVKKIDRDLREKYENIYINFSNRNVAFEILKVIQVNVCPYCNRQYTFTIKGKMRPEFDHFYPKSDYPYLAISIYNLVPSCGSCNKGKSKSIPKNFLYPYEESFEDKGIYFEIHNVVGNLLKQEKITVKLESINNNKDLIKQYNDSFKIELLYEQHSDYISELIYRNYIFNDEAIESIYNSYEGLFESPSELKQLVLGNCETYNFLQRPLSKLTNDILNQINYK